MNQDFCNSNSSGFDQFYTPQYSDVHQPPEEISIDELKIMMQSYCEMMSQRQEHAAQREQELPAQKQAAQEKEEPPQNSDFHQLIEEMCGIKASAEQKQNLEEMMLEWLELCREKELYCVHDSIEDLIGMAMNTMLLSINLKSQRLDKEKQEVKNIVEHATKCRTLIANTPDLPTEEPEDSLSMGDEHLRTISKMKANEVIKSSDKNLFPIPSEFKVTFDNERIEEANFDLEEEIHLVENLLYDNSSPQPPKELNAEISIFLKNCLVMILFPFLKNESSNFDHHDDPSFPRPPLEPSDVEVFFDFEPDTGVLTTKVVKGISEHYVLMPNILPTLPTLDLDLDFTPSHDSLRSINKIFDLGIFIEVQSERLLSWEEFSILFICDPLYQVFDTFLSFSSEHEDKVFKRGILSYLLISHRDKTTFDFYENPMLMYEGEIPLLDVLVLVIKPHNKTPYELFLDRKPALSFMRPFGCPVTILNTLDHLGTKENIDAGQVEKKIVSGPQYVLLPLLASDSQGPKSSKDEVADDAGKKSNKVPRKDTADTGIFGDAYDDEVEGAEADFNNLELTIVVSPIPTTRIHKDHLKEQIIGDLLSALQTKRMTKTSQEHVMRQCKMRCGVGIELYPGKAYPGRSSDRGCTEVDPRETSLRDDVMVRGSDEPHLEHDIDPEIQEEIDECIAYADALRDRWINDRVVVEAVDREESDLGTRGPVEVIEGVQREQGHRIVGVETAYTALTERVTELERDNMRLRGTVSVENQRVDRLERDIDLTSPRNLIECCVAEEMEAHEAAINLEPLNKNEDEPKGENGGGNEGNGNEGNRNGGNGGNRNGRNGGNRDGENGENGNENRNRNHGMNYGGFMPDSALTWLNSHKRTIGVDAAYAIKWDGLMKLMTKVYCPRNEIKKMETELWNLTVKGNDLTAYTQRFQELILLCTRMVPNEEDRVERFIRGLPDNIHGNMISANPARLQDAIRIANQLMDKKLQVKCNNCKKVGNLTRDCTTAVAPNTQRAPVGNQQGIVCYECGRPGHFRKDCPKLRDRNRGNQTRNRIGNKTGNQTGGNEATATAYAIGGGGTNLDSNVVTGTFLLNNCYASMLFDLGADRSFVSSTFIALLDVAPSTLDTSYAIELADGRISETNIVLRGCTLGLLGHPFDIDLMPVELGSFNVIIGMDW
nr:hypothetical protein [Tanacetum cinerariifolium]